MRIRQRVARSPGKRSAPGGASRTAPGASRPAPGALRLPGLLATGCAYPGYWLPTNNEPGTRAGTAALDLAAIRSALTLQAVDGL